ncbi:MAG: beta-galactosidase [Pirellulales bacterium]|nr:beta-galactosidase [Pirellulales bacterium]
MSNNVFCRFARFFVLFLLFPFSAMTASSALAEQGQIAIRVTSFELRPNLLPNSSFEKVEDKKGSPALAVGWNWHPGKTDATCSVDENQAHSGKRSLRITNNTPFGPHIYGMLRVPGDVAVKPNTTYTFSCYVKGENMGIAWFGGGRDWLVRSQFPKSTAGHWIRMEMSFKTDGKDARIPVMIVTESPCEPFWIDDVQLVEGAEPMPIVKTDKDDKPVLQVGFPGAPAIRHYGSMIIPEWNRTMFPRDKYVFTNRLLRAVGFLYLPKDMADGRLGFRLETGDGRTLAEQSQQGKLKAGSYKLEADCLLENVPNIGIRFRVTLNGELDDKSPGKKIASGSRISLNVEQERNMITADGVWKLLGEIEQQRDKLHQHVQTLREAKKDPAYPLVALTILDNFINFSREDLQREEVARAYDAVLQMRALAIAARMRNYLPPVPRYQTANVGRSFRLEGSKQLGTVRWPDGRIESERPLQFVGPGHFAQVKHDIEKANDYGFNIVQFEIGPRSVLPSENGVNTDVIDQNLEIFDRAAKAPVAINLLISPHYFPDWAYVKWPHLRDAGGGFLQVDVYAPEARQVYEKYLRTLIPRIKDHPALHSICLSNEPIFINGEKSPHVRKKWHDWLRREHGDIGTLNRRWGSKHADFDSIDVPPSEKFESSPIYVDYMRFNRESFAEFHAWMAGIIRDMAPDVPLHAKIMVHANFDRSLHGPWCVSPDLFARLSDINGNDCCKYYRGAGSWACDWLEENMGYDFQRSMGNKLVFNSENHLIPDRNLEPVPPEHIFNVFWQGAVHGQSATTTWVWERSYSYTSDITGSILHRPLCTEAMGRAGLDLMRLAREVGALQNLPLEVALLWSPASIVRDREHTTLVKQVYEALNFQGVRLGFVTERQLRDNLANGKLPPQLANLKLIVASGVSGTPEATVEALHKFRKGGGRVLCVGPCFTYDEYGHKREVSQQEKPFTSIDMPSTTRELFDALRPMLSEAGITHPVKLQTPDGQPAWGVEYLAAKHKGRLLVNLSNYLNEKQIVRVVEDSRPVVGIDLLSGKKIGPEIVLEPLQPVLLEKAEK